MKDACTHSRHSMNTTKIDFIIITISVVISTIALMFGANFAMGDEKNSQLHDAQRQIESLISTKLALTEQLSLADITIVDMEHELKLSREEVADISSKAENVIKKLNRDRDSNEEWPPTQHVQTHNIDCRRYPNLLEYCTYDHVCLASPFKRPTEKYIIILNDSIPVMENPWKGDIDYYMNHHYEFEVDDPQPFRSFFHVVFQHWDNLDPDNIEWVDGHSYANRFDGPEDYVNIYHWGVHLFPGLAARIQMLEDRLPMDEVQPALNDFEHCQKSKVFDRVFLDFNQSVANDWMKQTAYLSLGEPKCTEYHWRDTFWPRDKEFMCFKRLTVAGSSFDLFPGVRYAYRFRSMLAAKYNLDYKQEVVTFVKRTHNRFLKNMDEVVSALKNTTGMPVEIVSFDNASFEDQVRQMAKSGMLVSTHGSQLNNGIFMPPYSSTIELAPHRYLMSLGSRIHANAGNWYFVYEAPEDPKCQKECIGLSQKDVWTVKEHKCRSIDMYCDIWVDIRELCKIAGTAASISFGKGHSGHLGCKNLD